MAHPNQNILRIMQDRYIDNPEDDNFFLVDDVDEYDEPEDVQSLMADSESK